MIANAKNPRPAVNPRAKVPAASNAKNAPAQPAKAPARVTLIIRILVTLMPAASAALGYSPTDRLLKPQRVLNIAKFTANTMNSVARANIPFLKTLDQSKECRSRLELKQQALTVAEFCQERRKTMSIPQQQCL